MESWNLVWALSPISFLFTRTGNSGEGFFKISWFEAMLLWKNSKGYFWFHWIFNKFLKKMGLNAVCKPPSPFWHLGLKRNRHWNFFQIKLKNDEEMFSRSNCYWNWNWKELLSFNFFLKLKQWIEKKKY